MEAGPEHPKAPAAPAPGSTGPTPGPAPEATAPPTTEPAPTADPNRPATAGEAAKAFAAGAVKGAAIGLGLLALGTLGAAIGLGLLAFGVYRLLSGGYKEGGATVGRLASGKGTAADFDALGGVAGGIAAGGVAGILKGGVAGAEGGVAGAENAAIGAEAAAVVGKGELPKYSVGPYKVLRSEGEAGLDAHHVGQKALMRDLVQGYDKQTGPAILVPKEGHTIGGAQGILSRNTSGIKTARDVVARDIRELRRVYPDIQAGPSEVD